MSYRTIDPEGAHDLLADGWIYVDVRTVGEFEAGHPPGAFNVPVALSSPAGAGYVLNQDFAEVIAARFPTDSKLLLGCAAGGRSQVACEILAARGYPALYNVAGGFVGAPDQRGWRELGLPVAAAAEPGRSYAELVQAADGG